MDNSFYMQTTSFLVAAAMGFAISLIYDVFRILRLFAKPEPVSVFIQDIIFSLICAFLTFGLLIVRCQGEIRWFIFGGELLGFLICRFTLSMLIISAADKIIRAIKAVFRFIDRYLYSPIKKLKNKIVHFLYLQIRKFMVFFNQVLKNTMRMVYNKLKSRKFNEAGAFIDQKNGKKT
ncbi:MAG: hypothetical protein BGN88_07825 [Clostridiales bacterium 43-6]|nr:MAG: hypothetical protein BGN88_07825 [Clostridiales bacterium 43-6]